MIWIIAGIAILLVASIIVWNNLTLAAPPSASSASTLGQCGTPVCGQANAPVTIEIYSDFQ